MDLGTSTKTYVNGVPLAPNRPVRLNDRDRLNFGTAHSLERARDSSGKTKPARIFVYELRAPADWAPPLQEDEGDDGDETESDVREDSGIYK